MGLKINGSTSGSIEIDVPAVAGTDTSITIPAKNGGTFIVEESTGNIDLGPLDINGSASDDSVNIDASGRLLVGATSSDYGNVYLLIAGANSANYMAMLNTTASDASESRYSYLHFRGTQSGGEESSLVSIAAMHDGSSDDEKGRLSFRVNGGSDGNGPTERMKINNEGRCYVPGIYNFTSGVSANVAVDTDGQLRRATSSRKYKTDIETLEDSYADALLECRPVWYRSTADDSVENPHYGYYGFIAEEVAEIDPRLVFWKTSELSYDENGSTISSPCEPEAEGVQYDRFVPHLLNLIKRQKEQLETQAASIASLEARLTALEGGAS